MRATTSAEAEFLLQTVVDTIFACCYCCTCMGHGVVVNCQLAGSAPSKYEPAHKNTIFKQIIWLSIHSSYEVNKIND